MASTYETLLAELPKAPKTWLITGVAGFIGSNLLETLLKLDQRVVGLDNFATGHQRNLDEVQAPGLPRTNGPVFSLLKAISAIWQIAQRHVTALITCCTRPHWAPCHARWKTPS